MSSGDLYGLSKDIQEFFIRQLAASGSDLFGLKFYAPWVMRLIKRHSSVNYQPSARNHLIFLPEVDMSVEAIYFDPAKKPLCLQNAEHQSFTQPIEGVQAATRIYPLAGNTRLPHRAPTEATESPLPKGLGSILAFSMIENFLWPFIRNRINITFGSRDRCKASWCMSIAFATLPPRMPLLLMKPAGDHGRA